MQNEIKTSIVVDLKGNLDRQLKRNEKNIQRFSRTSSRNLKGLGRTTTKLNKSFGGMGKKIAAIATAAAAIRSVNKVVEFDANLTRMQTDARMTVEEIAVLKKELISLANDPNIRLDKTDILSGFDKVIAMTGDKSNAMKNLRNMALFMQATKTAGEDAGTMIGIAFKNGTTEASEVLNLLGVQYKQSLTGAVPIRELARTGKGLISPVTSVVGSTPDVLTDATAVAQIIIDATKNADITAETLKAFMSVLNKKEVQEKFRNAGVEFRQPNSKMLRKPSKLIPEIFDVTKGDFTTLNKYFGETAVKVFQGFAKPAGPGVSSGRDRLKELAAMTADGSLVRGDARINASTAKAAQQSISNKTSEIMNSIISQPSKDIANAMDNFQATDTWTNVKAIDYALGAVVKRFTVDVFNDMAELTVGNARRGIKSLFTDDSPQPGVVPTKSINGKKESSLANDIGAAVGRELNNKEAKLTVSVEPKGGSKATVKKVSSKNMQVDVDSGLAVGGMQ